MTNIKKSPVLVSGGSGYLASHIIQQLLAEGYTLHTTVRNKSNTEKYSHLTDLAKNSKGRLVIFEADLLKPDSFAEAMQQCSHVFHTASPFKIDKIKNPQQELIDPAVNGTKNILETVNATESVKRVVLTSSIVAIMGDAVDAEAIPDRVFTEKIWNTSSGLSHQPYSYSKTLAEKTAWEI